MRKNFMNFLKLLLYISIFIQLIDLFSSSQQRNIFYSAIEESCGNRIFRKKQPMCKKGVTYKNFRKLLKLLALNFYFLFLVILSATEY